MTDITPMHPTRDEPYGAMTPSLEPHTSTVNRRDVLLNALNGDGLDERALETLCDWLGGIRT